MVLSKRQNGHLTQLPRLAIDPKQRQADYVLLSSDHYHYLERVRRLRVGDPFIIFDGSGHQWLARLAPERSPIEDCLPGTVIELPVSVHMGLAVLKGSGYEDTLRSLTELGVHEITPLLTQYTQVDPGTGKQGRWHKIALEAAEQCERLYWPQIQSPQLWLSWLQSLRVDRVIMCVTRLQVPHLGSVLQQDPTLTSLAVAVGPEGGWSPDEIQQGLDHQVQLVTLGSRILRATTAPIVAASLIAGFWESR